MISLAVKKLLMEAARTLQKVEECLSNQVGDYRLLRKVSEARENFKRLSSEATVNNERLAKFLLGKTRELLKKCSSSEVDYKTLKDDIDALLRYSRAAFYDFTNKWEEIRRAYRAYIAGMIPYFIVSGFFGMAYAITALIIFFPAIFGITGVKRRSYLGLMLSLFAIPMPLVVGAIAIRYGIYVIEHPEEIAGVSNALGISLSAAKILVIILPVLGAIELVLLLIAFYYLYKNRHAFL